MKLYEVNQAIESVIDQMVDIETGEILPVSDELMEQLNSLEMERERILGYLAKLVLNTRAEAAALREEETRLKNRRDRLEKKENRLMEILDRECGGEKTNLGVATFSYRKTSRLEVSDAAKAIRWLKRNKHHDCYRVKDPEVAKTEVKKLINAGIKVPGCAVVEDKSCSLK
ncbi:MAG: siphovirus Gp157 family protein [Oscillospiraceae bacterium]|nr:siphovirus Gp157 family protein [Clostridiales bacterium]MCD8144204.1 siphovirus Gp157 family protein [Oscillospiraceae bacterium]